MCEGKKKETKGKQNKTKQKQKQYQSQQCLTQDQAAVKETNKIQEVKGGGGGGGDGALANPTTCRTIFCRKSSAGKIEPSFPLAEPAK